MEGSGRGLGLALVGLGLLAMVTIGVLVVTLLEEDQTGPSSGEDPVSAPALASLDSYLESIIEPLRQAAIDHDHDPAEFLPSEEAEAAALITGSLESPETREVLQVLRESYAFFKMRFPGSPSGEGSAGESDRIAGTDPSAALRPYFELRLESLEGLARTHDEAPESWLPSPKQVDQAVQSGSLGSPEASLVLDTLRAGHNHFGEVFPEPLLFD